MTWRQLVWLGLPFAALSLLTACDGGEETTGGQGASGPTSTSTTSGGGGSGGSVSYDFTTVAGFNTPESCYWDATNNVWYVSNIAPPPNGDITTPDGQGWISRLDENGTLMEMMWIQGLNSPAGLRMSNNLLYVADIDYIRAIDVATATVAGEVQVPGVVGFLNDMAVDDAAANVYISDTLGDAVYIAPANLGMQAVPFALLPPATGPNGLLVDGNRLIVSGLGDFTTADSFGPMLSIDLMSGGETPFGDLMGKLDGIEKDGDSFLVSDFTLAQIHRVDAASGSHTVLYDLSVDQGLVSTADIGFDPVRRIICIPDLQSGTVSFLTMK